MTERPQIEIPWDKIRIPMWLRWVGGVLLLITVLLGYTAKRAFDDLTEGLPEDLSDLRDYRPPTACQITDKNGEVLDTFYVERRYPVVLDQVPDHVWQAFVAAEDRRFFDHPGVDLLGILRALMVNVKAGRTVEGGSTLTQQLVKNILLTSEKSLERKAQEAVLAYRMERTLDKWQILNLYMDLVYLGSGNYGVEAAARDYFGKPAAELNPAEVATITALIPAPSRYSPRTNPKEALRRRRLVLRAMVEEGWLPPDHPWNEHELKLSPGGRGADRGDRTSYITVVRREVQRLFGDDATVGGLTVVTPYDATVQEAAVTGTREAAEAHTKRQGPRVIKARSGKRPAFPEQSCFNVQVGPGVDLRDLRAGALRYSLRTDDHYRTVFDERDGKRRPLRSQLKGGEILAVCLDEEAPASTGSEVQSMVRLDDSPWAQSAAVVVDHRTGEVVAVTAGVGPGELEGFVRGVQATRQPGSSFKPYVYAGAFKKAGLGQLSIIVDRPISYGSWTPKNYSGGYSGRMTIRTALTRSTNTVAVQLIAKAGPEYVADLAYNLGVRTPLRPDLTMALGSSEVTPLDQAMGYAAIARGGVPTDPVFITEVRDAAGNVLARPGELLPNGRRLPGGEQERALEPGIAHETLDMMRSVVQFGTGRRAFRKEQDRAGKTGTTNNFVDAWFVGVTPTHAIAVWVGSDGSGTLGDKETGGKASLPAWIKIADTLPKEPARFAIPDEAVMVNWRGQRVAIRRGGVPSEVLPLPSLDGRPLAVLDR
ncbi:MAG: PBP1A family penicillin-binding protein [Myxococcales bacterium]|nr:PBP1A family penicillin-binding protein [Myxococcales bacterium]